MEFLEGEGDSVGGGGAAALVGVLEHPLELEPVLGLGIGDGDRGDDSGDVGFPGGRVPGAERGGSGEEGVGEMGRQSVHLSDRKSVV